MVCSSITVHDIEQPEHLLSTLLSDFTNLLQGKKKKPLGTEFLNDDLLFRHNHFLKGSTINHFNVFILIMEQHKISCAQMV